MKHVYARGWFRAKCRPLELLTSEVARSLHESGKPYAVLVGGDLPCRPESFLEINAAVCWVGVSFLDSELRPYVEYSFACKDDEHARLFLERAVYREFQENSVDPIATVHYFEPDGSYTVEEWGQFDYVKTNEAVNPIDVSTNWEVMPGFGDYDSIGRLER